MNISTCKQNVKKTKQTNLSNEELFNKAWKKVSKQQIKNDRLREKIKSFAEKVSESIEQKEKAYLDTLYQSCEHLLVFYGRKSLAAWQREMLMEWILDYLSTISNNPFSADLDLSSFYQAMEGTMEKIHPDEFNTFEDEPIDSEDEQDPFDAMDDDLFSDFQHQEETFEQPVTEDDEQALNKLMKGATINKLFRRVARILHPDREQDETARVEKNRLMSELIEARDTNDITTLFAFYAEYIGKSPLEDLGGDLADATKLLNRQYEQLRAQHTEIIYEDRKSGILYQRFHKKTMKASLHGLNDHKAELEQNMNNLKLFCQGVTSLNKLKPYLQLRWEHLYGEHW